MKEASSLLETFNTETETRLRNNNKEGEKTMINKYPNSYMIK